MASVEPWLCLCNRHHLRQRTGEGNGKWEMVDRLREVKKKEREGGRGSEYAPGVTGTQAKMNRGKQRDGQRGAERRREAMARWDKQDWGQW